MARRFRDCAGYRIVLGFTNAFSYENVVICVLLLKNGRGRRVVAIVKPIVAPREMRLPVSA
jgi:hypothetical protein